MSFTAPGECEDKDHIVIGDKIMFDMVLLKEIVERRTILVVKEIKPLLDGTKTVVVTND